MVIASSICTKTGKALVSRQFVEMPRTRIEGLLASFPKLMTPGQQHTTVETETIRYVYQPIGEEMYAVLITSRKNNIVQDMDTLQLIARAVSDICDVNDQEGIASRGFDLLVAFDEIIAQGYRDNIDLAKLRTIMEMESHEEEIQKIIERNKEREAKQELKRKAKMFDQQRREAAKQGLADPGLGGIGSSRSGGMGSMMGGSGRGSYEPLLSREPEPMRNLSNTSSPAPSVVSNVRGMKLGRKPKGADVMGAMKGEVDLAQGLSENLSIADAASASVSNPTAAAAAATVAQPPEQPIYTKAVHVQIEEHIVAVVNRDGGVEQMEVKGDLSLVVVDETCGNIQVGVSVNDQHKAQIKTHPKIDKKNFQNNSVIALKDTAGTFPLSQPIGVLKWRIVSDEEDDIPFTINCWPSPNGSGSVDVNIEYELNNTKLELDDVVVSIPIPHGAQPNVSDVDGMYNVDRARGQLQWQIPTIDASNNTGSLDFSVAGGDASAFFPATVSFHCKKPYYNIEVDTVTNKTDGQAVDFSQTVALIPDQYAVI